MKTVSYKICSEFNNISSEEQYIYIKIQYPQYIRIWDINQGLLELSRSYSTLINNNNDAR